MLLICFACAQAAHWKGPVKDPEYVLASGVAVATSASNNPDWTAVGKLGMGMFVVVVIMLVVIRCILQSAEVKRLRQAH